MGARFEATGVLCYPAQARPWKDQSEWSPVVLDRANDCLGNLSGAEGRLLTDRAEGAEDLVPHRFVERSSVPG